MWFSFIPILAMGVFLMVIWNMISPIRFIQQLKKERAEKTNGRPIHIREFNPDDTAETAQIFFDAVRIGTVLYYNQSQREAWAPKLPNHEQWCQKLSMQEVFVAEDNAGLIGFMSLNNDGCIDLAFVKPDSMGMGVAKKLYSEIESHAYASGLLKLYTEASLLARPFFEREGWGLVKEQSTTINDVELTNFRMEKTL